MNHPSAPLLRRAGTAWLLAANFFRADATEVGRRCVSSLRDEERRLSPGCVNLTDHRFACAIDWATGTKCLMTRPLPALPAAVFCHSQWRTGSTALFNAFRADPRFMCFYEPLHEGLRTMTRRKAARFDPEDIKRMGHDGLSKPYFAEYVPLLTLRGGVSRFPGHLSYKEFFEISARGQMNLRGYFRCLLDLAQSRNKVPVFCLNRSWGRMKPFREMFPDSVHVFSLRGPAETWHSQQARRSYFFARLLYILSQAEPNRFGSAFPELTGLSILERLRVAKTFKQKIGHISDDRIAPVFWQAYACALLNGALYADFILDLSQTASKQDDREALGQYLAPLPMLCEGQPLPDGLKALQRLAPAASHHGTANFSEWCEPCSFGPMDRLLRNRDMLRKAACRAGPKLAPANRQILGDLISDRAELAAMAHTA